MSHDHHQPPKIIETSHISPPNGTVSTTTLPLTFFDVPWLLFPHGESVYFFSYAKSTDLFLKEILPNLKQTLSITLQHFFPYAGNLIIPPRPDPPYLRYVDGEDYLLFTVTESIRTDFEDLITDSPKKIGILRDFLPKLPPPHVSKEGFQIRATMSLQITIFPGYGICIGNTSTHVAGDGVSLIHFMRYWMSLTKSNGGDPHISPPIHSCRDVIKDPGEVSAGFLEQFWSQNSDQAKDPPPENMVRARFTISRTQIENLKRWVTEQSSNQSPVSTFVVTLAFPWVCLIKTLLEDDETEAKDVEEDEDFYLVINVDCRNRLKYLEPVPSNYFGNCMAPGLLSVKKKDLIGENGVLAALNAITAKIKELLSSDLRKTATTWRQGLGKLIGSRYSLSTAGAPKLGLYSLDFGLGKPCKVEIVHIEETGRAIAFSESKDGSNGVEIELVLEKKKMETFASILQEGISKFHV